MNITACANISPRLDDFDDLLAAARRAAKELELARAQAEEVPRGLPVIEQPLSVVQANDAGAVGHEPELARIERGEQVDSAQLVCNVLVRSFPRR